MKVTFSVYTKRKEIKRLSAMLGIAAIVFSFLDSESSLAQSPQNFSWSNVPAFSMAGDLKAYWNVVDASMGEMAKNAHDRGFKPVTILSTYRDVPYARNEKGSGAKDLSNHWLNPWLRSPSFEAAIRHNIEKARPVSRGIYVHDIELPIVRDTKQAWMNEATRQAAGSVSRETFDENYFSEWAKWFQLPLEWTNERYPGVDAGIYGIQPFDWDDHILTKNASQIHDTHQADWRLWKLVEPYVDFAVASIYFNYDNPDSVFYMAANVEANYLRTHSSGGKPVYAYEWMRFTRIDPELKGKELPSYLVEAMAIVPYFSGAKGVVLWGWEPQVKSGTQQPYEQLPLFVRSLKRVATLSEKLARGRLLIDRPAHEVWKAHGPLIRKVMVDDDECIVMAINPWQSDDKRTTYPVQCGQLSAQISVDGRHTTLAVLNRRGLQIY
ncbi:hypothetical protein [Mesorhizobium sp. M1403]|uniref:hypothetical protein n=1 Tax=Mesorhizobium sp. M1403 TaxID=2957097 RepID=UPI00333604B7